MSVTWDRSHTSNLCVPSRPLRLCGNSSHLDAGESEAIAMSLEWPADLLIMDESSGLALARNLNIRITGTLDVLLKAKSNVSSSKRQQNQASCH